MLLEASLHLEDQEVHQSLWHRILHSSQCSISTAALQTLARKMCTGSAVDVAQVLLRNYHADDAPLQKIVQVLSNKQSQMV